MLYGKNLFDTLLMILENLWAVFANLDNLKWVSIESINMIVS